MPVFREEMVAGHTASIFKRQRMSVRWGWTIIYYSSVPFMYLLKLSLLSYIGVRKK